MKKILVTGASGQIGAELVPFLQNIYGFKNIIASDIKESPQVNKDTCVFEYADVNDMKAVEQCAVNHKVDAIMHMAAMLSAVGERNPLALWNLNMNGTLNALEISKKHNLRLFVPSSIAAFGSNSPANDTPQDTIQRPSTIYGVSKVAGELLCDYYFNKFNVDVRGLRFPGLISNVAMPGGGTTDYAVSIYYDAVEKGKFICPLREDTFMDMMYMPDALQAIVDLMSADTNNLVHRNAFNVSAMSFNPAMIAEAIKKHIPDFTMEYEVNDMLQNIADSWPNFINVSAAEKEWNFACKYDISSMSEDMIKKVKIKLNK